MRSGHRRRRHRSPLLWLCVASVVVVGAVPAQASPAAPCRSAQFTIAGPPVGTGPTTSQTIEVGTLVGLGDVCPLTPPRKRRATKAGITRIRARWESCAGFDGPVRLRAKVVDGCTAVTD